MGYPGMGYPGAGYPMAAQPMTTESPSFNSRGGFQDNSPTQNAPNYGGIGTRMNLKVQGRRRIQDFGE